MSEIRVDKLIAKTSASSIKADRSTSDGDIIELQKDGTTIGSIGAESDDLYIESTATNHSGIRFLGASLRPRYNGATSDNVIDIGSSTMRFNNLYLGGNIYLGGTGSANALDDYEEGTFTPTLALVSVTYTSQSGTYTKIGNQVFITVDITTATLDNTDNSDFTISGIPFNNDGNSCIATINKEVSTIFTNPSIVDSFRIGLSSQFRAFRPDGTSFDYNDGTTSGRLLVKIQYTTA